MLNINMVDEIIHKALREDIGTGDITTLSTVPKNKQITGRFIAKEDGIVCGIDVLKRVFELIDKNIQVFAKIEDGDKVKPKDMIAEICGPAIGILTGERVALNFIQRLSGISTQANKLAEIVKDTKAEIVDTRKTTPGLRILEKYAVKIGGASNHRFNLADGVLIKDNHIKAAGGITNAVNAAKSNAPHTLKIEVEVETLKQVDEALEAGADIIMLDNMDLQTMKKAVCNINGRALVEASGNMGDRDLKQVADTGVDLISVGALTHSVKAMDISLKFN